MAIYLFRCPMHGEFDSEMPMTGEIKASCPLCGANGARVYTKPVINGSVLDINKKVLSS